MKLSVLSLSPPSGILNYKVITLDIHQGKKISPEEIHFSLEYHLYKKSIFSSNKHLLKILYVPFFCC